MKPWGRIELDYINHDKFLALNATAIVLWHEGKNYADMKHTDGLIPTAAAKRFRFYGAKAVALLLQSAGLKPGTEVPYAPLWEVVEGFGYKMHAYIEHNDDREKVLARIASADADRERRAANQAAYRERRKAERQQTETPALPITVPITGPITRDQQMPALSDKQKQLHNQKHNHNKQEEERVTDSASDRVMDAFRAEWKQLYGYECSLILSQLEQMKLDQQVAKYSEHQLLSALPAYFTTADKYILRERHPLALFLRDPLRYLATEVGPPKLSSEEEAAEVLAILKRRDAGDWS